MPPSLASISISFFLANNRAFSEKLSLLSDDLSSLALLLCHGVSHVLQRFLLFSILGELLQPLAKDMGQLRGLATQQ